MTDILDKTKLDIGRVRDDVNRIIQVRGLKQAAVARESGVSGAALSRFLADRYDGDNEAIAAKLVGWSEALAHRDSLSPLLQKHEFINTSAALKIGTGLNHAQITADLVAVVGAPGVGKTATLEQFRLSSPNVWLATMSPDTSSKVPMLEELGYAMGLNVTGGAASMRRQIAARIRNTGGLIIIDEAQHLDAKAIETLRIIHDTTKIGMILCGNPKLMTTISQLPQVYSRLGRRVTLGKPSRPDVSALASGFGITGREEADLLYSLSQYPGGLRCVVKVIRLALLTALGTDTPASMKRLAAAWSELALEEME
ncbi:AAA family ATPase [Pararhodospirillum photometricum]|uniref:ATPase n=1 Tax=Pararhodospirillum photometricum DSM 122 TaxID=1150469 RepID=H6SNB5_PARPM|nr:AAA family ATPase [Pararhodospirillum photometricum]CCG06991.1 ATPase [Pararhodospirillum photometricum DSM 122]